MPLLLIKLWARSKLLYIWIFESVDQPKQQYWPTYNAVPYLIDLDAWTRFSIFVALCTYVGGCIWHSGESIYCRKTVCPVIVLCYVWWTTAVCSRMYNQLHNSVVLCTVVELQLELQDFVFLTKFTQYA